MQDLITIDYTLRNEKRQERDGDEPRLEFVFITGIGGQLQVQVVDTGLLVADHLRGVWASGSISLEGLKVHAPLSPTSNNRFFGFAVRAFESDSNSTQVRADTQDTIIDNVTSVLGPIVESGDIPTVSPFWLAVNSGNTVSGDEYIGVSARIYPHMYSNLVRNGRRNRVPHFDERANDEFLFNRESTRWRMPFSIFHQSFG